MPRIEPVTSALNVRRAICLGSAVHRALRTGGTVGLVASGIVALGPSASAAAADPVFPGELEVCDLLPERGGDGSEGVALTAYVYGQGGRSVGFGDINGDGIDDVLVTAWDSPNRMATHILFGRSVWPAEIYTVDLRSDHGGDGSEGFSLPGSTRAAVVGDINDDGFADVAVADTLADPDGRTDAGASYVVFSHAPPFAAEFDFHDLLAANGGDGGDGFVVEGVGAGDQCCNVARAGDVNGDAIDDIVLGASLADPDGRVDAGSGYVVFGRANGFPAELELSSLQPAQGGDGTSGFVFTGIEAGDRCCFVNGAGDVDGDGVGDLVLGAPRASPGGQSEAGEAYLLLGRAGVADAQVDLSELLAANGGDGSGGTVYAGATEDERAGGSVAGVGDLNGDGYADIAVGAYRYGGYSFGRGYVVFGGGDRVAEMALSSLLSAYGGDGSEGVILSQGYEPPGYYNLGRSVAAAGDLNGDGADDLLVGASGIDTDALYDHGDAYVIFGHDPPFPAELIVPALHEGDGSEGVAFAGCAGGTGYAVAGGGDVNGDGVDDIIVGVLGSDYSTNPGGYVFFGRAATPDTDDDGVADDADNCTLVANPDQRDSNGDGFGNLCDPDLDDNNIVNFADLGAMKLVFFTTAADADLTGDGRVNFQDLALLRQYFFEPPGPSGIAVASPDP